MDVQKSEKHNIHPIQHPSNLYVNNKISEYDIQLFVLFIYFYIHFLFLFVLYYSIIYAGTEEGEDSTQTTSRLLPSHRCHVVQYHLPSSIFLFPR
jgi:hypothetical protein